MSHMSYKQKHALVETPESMFESLSSVAPCILLDCTEMRAIDKNDNDLLKDTVFNRRVGLFSSFVPYVQLTSLA